MPAFCRPETAYRSTLESVLLDLEKALERAAEIERMMHGDKPWCRYPLPGGYCKAGGKGYCSNKQCGAYGVVR